MARDDRTTDTRAEPAGGDTEGQEVTSDGAASEETGNSPGDVRPDTSSASPGDTEAPAEADSAFAAGEIPPVAAIALPSAAPPSATLGSAVARPAATTSSGSATGNAVEASGESASEPLAETRSTRRLSGTDAPTPQSPQNGDGSSTGENSGDERAASDEATTRNRASLPARASESGAQSETIVDADTPANNDARMPSVVARDSSVSPALGRALEVERTIAASAREAVRAQESSGGRPSDAVRVVAPDVTGGAMPAPGVAAQGGHATLSAGLSLEPGTALPSDATTTTDADPTPVTARALGVIAKQQGGTLSMRLDPPTLGDLRVTLTIERGSVVADIQPSTKVAHDLLSGGLATLREALERQGLHVERLSVHAPPSKAEQAATTSSQPNPHTSSAAQGPDRPESRGDSRNDGSQDSRRGQSQHDAGGGASRGRDEHRESQRGRERTAQVRRASFSQTLESVPS